MPKKKEQSFELPSLDDIFSTQEMRDDEKLRKVRDIPIELIDDFPDHPFKVIENEDMMELVESIRNRGVLTPTVVREKEDGRYEMVSGHRRKYACQLIGLETIPAEIKELDRDDATIYMVESNLQRSVILPSEKAFSCKMQLEAMKRKAGRPKKNDVPLAQNFRGKSSRQILGEQLGESQDQIRRYIRLTELIPEILQMVDDGKIALRPAVEISYFPTDLQQDLLETMEVEDCTPSFSQTVKMRKLLAEDKLTPEVIYSIMQEEKPNQKEKIILRDDRVRKLIPTSIPRAKTEEYVIKALEFYGRHRERQNRESR